MSALLARIGLVASIAFAERPLSCRHGFLVGIDLAFLDFPDSSARNVTIIGCPLGAIRFEASIGQNTLTKIGARP